MCFVDFKSTFNTLKSQIVEINKILSVSPKLLYYKHVSWTLPISLMLHVYIVKAKAILLIISISNFKVKVCMRCVCIRPPDKSAYWNIILFISHPKHMVWALKRAVSMRRSP